MKYKIVAFLLTLLFAASFTMSVMAIPSEQKIIRVGYPLTDVFSEMDEEGNFKGYAYDYLIEIAKYTGWKYEFIPKGGNEMGSLLEMLQKGEVDIIPGVIKNSSTEELYDYPEMNCGITYATIVARNDNAKLVDGDYETFKGIKVGVARKAKQRIEKMERFFALNGIEYEIIYCETEEDAAQMVQEGEADVYLSSDLVQNDQVRIVARFSSEPYYFAVAPGKTDIMSQLNGAISRIKDVNVNYDMQLYYKYFPQFGEKIFVLSDSEKSYVEKMDTLTVVSGFNSIPVDYFDVNGNYSGITADVFKRISEMSGIKFRYIQAETLLEAHDILMRGEADIMTGVFGETQLKELDGIITFSPYMVMPMAMAKRSNLELDKLKSATLALPLGCVEEDERTKALHMKFYNTTEQCMLAIQKGEVDYMYSNVYSTEYYKRNANIKNVSILPLSGSDKPLSFATLSSVDVTLLSVINKAINSISESERKEIMYKSTFSTEDTVSFRMFISKYFTETALIVLILIIIFLLIFTNFYYKKKNIEQKFAQRYRMMADLTGEIIFEYDCERDRLSITGKDSHRLGLASTTNQFMKYLNDQDFNVFSNRDFFIRILSESAKGSEDVLWLCSDGTGIWFHAVFMHLLNKKGELMLCIGKLRNIDAEHSEKMKLITMARKDTLTGLYNKGTAEQLCGESLCKENAAGIQALLIVDIDNFKYVNDTYGHCVGDEVLKHISCILSSSFRSGDIVGRIGGDEFSVLMRNLDGITPIEEKVRYLLYLLEEEICVNDCTIPISCSIGISVFPDHGLSYGQLYQNADTALYEMKKDGKKGFKFYQEKMLRLDWAPYSDTKIDSEIENSMIY